MSALRLRLVREVAEFQALYQTWNSVLDRSYDRNIFLSWEWQFTWWQHFGQGKQLNILVVEYDGQVIAIAPLMRSRFGLGILGLEALENISNNVGDYGGLILGDRHEEAVGLLLDYLQGEIDKKNTVVTISRVPEDSTLVRSLRNRVLGLHNTLALYERPMFVCPYLAITTSYEAHVASLPQNTRANLRRRMRNLNKEYKVCFNDHTNGRLREDMEVLFRLHEDRLASKEEEMQGLFSDQKRRAFAVDVTDALNRNGWVSLSFLTANGQPISGVLGFEYGAKFYYYKPAFDPDYSNYGPGHLHIMHLLEQSVARGATEFDFLRGEEPYKQLWTNAVRKNLMLVLVRPGFVGRTHFNSFKLLRRLGMVAA